MSLGFTGERIVPGAVDCEPHFAQKMYQEHLARYAFAAQFAAGADVLDVGCGVGYGSQWLGKAGARSVFGFDLAADAIEHARHNYFHPAVSFAVGDAAQIDSRDGYDLVTCFELIEHVEEQERVLDGIKAALRPGGILAISTPRPLDDIRTHFHVHEMSFEELYGLLRQRFAHVEAFFQVNCFTSFVGREAPAALDNILPVTDRVRMENADYFVFLASDQPFADRRAPARPVLTLNDDRYILTLEHDVGVLRKAEQDHLARIADQEHEKHALGLALADAENRNGMFSTLRNDLQDLRGELQQMVRSVEQPGATIAALADLRRDLASLTAQAPAEPATAEALAELHESLDRLHSRLTEQAQPAGAELLAHLARLDETAELRRSLLQAKEQLAVAQSDAHAALMAGRQEADSLTRQRDELAGLVHQQAQELDAVRRAIADHAHRLAEAETRANGLAGDSSQLAEARARAAALENEVNAMRYRLEYAERTLARFRNSLSWALTRPIRWIGRTFKILTGRSLPQ